MKRQRGRNRNNNNKNRNHNHNNHNRSMDSNGPDVKVRGNAATIYEKYQTLARDAKTSGSRVKAENYLQHAEHYLRLVNAQEAAKAEAKAKADAERAARGEKNDEDGDDDNRRNHRNRNQRRDRDEPRSTSRDDASTNETPAELDVVTPTADVAVDVKPRKKAAPKPRAKKVDKDDGEDKPARRRKAPTKAKKSEEAEPADQAQI